ncbi:MAG: hypothetical protein AB1529_00035 [Candidatus Micrarchaeota archaeon]
MGGERVRTTSESAGRHGQAEQAPPQMETVSPQRRAQLEASLNYPNNPGYHTLRSPAAGSRSSELMALRGLAPANPALLSFADALYQPEFVHLIPARQARRAEALSLEIFRRYLSRYAASGLDENNAVVWAKMDLTRTYIASTENQHNTWNVQPIVYNQTHMKGGRCLPRFIAALHEFMHVEETPRGAAMGWDAVPSPPPAQAAGPVSSVQAAAGGPSIEMLSELMPTIMTLVLSDEVYKRLNNIPLNRAVNYGQSVQWDGHSVQLGRVANFYRSLIDRYGSVGAAAASPESLEFMRQGRIPPAMVTPVRAR